MASPPPKVDEKDRTQLHQDVILFCQRNADVCEFRTWLENKFRDEEERKLQFLQLLRPITYKQSDGTSRRTDYVTSLIRWSRRSATQKMEETRKVEEAAAMDDAEFEELAQKRARRRAQGEVSSPDPKSTQKKMATGGSGESDIPESR